MAQRILALDGEVILSSDTDVVNPTGKPSLRVFLPVIDGVAVAPGWQVSVTSTSIGNTVVLDHKGLTVVMVGPRGSKQFTAVEFPGYGWQHMDLPTTFPGSRVVGGSGGGVTLPILESDVTNLTTDLSAKAPLVHTHAAADINSGVLAAARLPVSTTASFGAVEVDNNSSGTPVALTASGHGSAADPHPQYALDTAKGANNGIATLDGVGKLTASQLPLGTSSTTAAAGNDSRLSDNRAPLAHATTHQPGGSDAMAVDAVAATGSLRTLGVGAAQATSGTDARLSDTRTPKTHAATHQTAGSDAIALDTLAATTDITTLNSSTTAHGLLPKLGGGTANFLRADGTWAAPVATLPDLPTHRRLCAVNTTIAAGYSSYVSPDYEIAAGIYLECAVGACMEIG